MKTNELLILLAVAVVGYQLVTRKRTIEYESPTEILPGDGSAGFGNGWKYFSDGVAIGPDGRYYKNGVLMYTP